MCTCILTPGCDFQFGYLKLDTCEINFFVERQSVFNKKLFFQMCPLSCVWNYFRNKCRGRAPSKVGRPPYSSVWWNMIRETLLERKFTIWIVFDQAKVVFSLFEWHQMGQNPYLKNVETIESPSRQLNFGGTCYERIVKYGNMQCWIQA